MSTLSLDLPCQNPRESLSIPTIARQSRFASLEILRLAACIGVVWFHCKAPGATIGYAGLPALIALSVALASDPHKPTSLSQNVQKRAKRLLQPWLFWSLVYVIWHMFGAYRKGLPVLNVLEWRMIFTGTALHLWYLPFAFVTTTIAGELRNFVRINSPAMAVVTAISLPASIIGCSWYLSHYDSQIPIPQWVFGIPAVCIGLMLPHYFSLKQQFISAGFVSSIAASSCVVAWLLGWNSLSIPYLIGTLAVVVAWISTLRSDASILRISNLSFGIYLVHPLVQSIVRILTGLQEGSLCALVVTLLSTCLVAVMRRGPLRQMM